MKTVHVTLQNGRIKEFRATTVIARENGTVRLTGATETVPNDEDRKYGYVHIAGCIVAIVEGPEDE